MIRIANRIDKEGFHSLDDLEQELGCGRRLLAADRPCGPQS